MEQALVDDVTLEYEVSGLDEPVVFIQGVLIADAFAPLLAEPDLTSHYQLIAYHRRGYMGSSRAVASVSIARQAADCWALLHRLGVQRAHVVGHSYGGAIALQLALNTPEVVQSLALLEPALMVGASASSYRDSLARAVARYREGVAADIVAEFLRTRWPGYRGTLDRVLPGAFAQAVADAGTTFEVELPALPDWDFGETAARRIDQPVLSVLGGDSEALSPRFGEAHRLLLTWLPHAEGVVLPGTTHFLSIENPHGLAEALVAFWARCPIQM